MPIMRSRTGADGRHCGKSSHPSVFLFERRYPPVDYSL
jgi:hypothetical protein